MTANGAEDANGYTTAAMANGAAPLNRADEVEDVCMPI